MPEIIYLIGCGGHARSVADVLLGNDPGTTILFVDANAREGERILGYEVRKELPQEARAVHVALGDSLIRERFFSASHVSVVSRDAYVSQSAILGAGVFVGHMAYVGPEARIGNGCIINTRSIIEHETKVGDFCHISVNSTLLGRVTIGSHVFVGGGAVVRNGVQICADVTLGVGSVVVKDITIPGVYVGNPARLLQD